MYLSWTLSLKQMTRRLFNFSENFRTKGKFFFTNYAWKSVPRYIGSTCRQRHPVVFDLSVPFLELFVHRLRAAGDVLNETARHRHQTRHIHQAQHLAVWDTHTHTHILPTPRGAVHYQTSVVRTDDWLLMLKPIFHMSDFFSCAWRPSWRENGVKKHVMLLLFHVYVSRAQK